MNSKGKFNTNVKNTELNLLKPTDGFHHQKLVLVVDESNPLGSFGGAIIFGIASFVEHSQMAVAIAFFFTGTLVGSMFSLGITYMADLTPKELMPTGNLLCGIALSIGSLTGPFLGGIYLEYVNYSFLLLVAILLLAIAIILLVFGRNKNKRPVSV